MGTFTDSPSSRAKVEDWNGKTKKILSTEGDQSSPEQELAESSYYQFEGSLSDCLSPRVNSRHTKQIKLDGKMYQQLGSADQRTFRYEFSNPLRNLCVNDDAQADGGDVESIIIREKEPNLWGPAIEIIGLGGVTCLCLVTLSFFCLNNPPYDPISMSACIALGITVVFTIDITFQTIVGCCSGTLCHGRYLFNVLAHHLISIVFLMGPIYYEKEKYYILMLSFLSVEVNTLLLKIRRILNRGTFCYSFLNYSFLITWILLRLVLFPILTAYLFIIWWRNGHHFDLILSSAIMSCLLIVLYIIWTVNLLGKQKNTKLAECTIAITNEPRISTFADPPHPDFRKCEGRFDVRRQNMMAPNSTTAPSVPDRGGRSESSGLGEGVQQNPAFQKEVMQQQQQRRKPDSYV